MVLCPFCSYLCIQGSKRFFLISTLLEARPSPQPALAVKAWRTLWNQILSQRYSCNDSNALFYLFGISLAGIHDIQLMELVTRTFLKRCVNGLSKCIERDLYMGSVEAEKWKRIKDKGKLLFAPEYGGNYDVFNSRPLSEDIRLYCLQDVQFMPRLWNNYYCTVRY